MDVCVSAMIIYCFQHVTSWQLFTDAPCQSYLVGTYHLLFDFTGTSTEAYNAMDSWL